MAKSQQGGKSKRPQSEHKKLLRAGSRRSAAQRHLALAQAQELRHRHNLRLDGELTPWQQAEAGRAARRLSTCGKCRILFEDGKCPSCGQEFSLADMWRKRHDEPLPAA